MLAKERVPPPAIERDEAGDETIAICVFDEARETPRRCWRGAGLKGLSRG